MSETGIDILAHILGFGLFGFLALLFTGCFDVHNDCG